MTLLPCPSCAELNDPAETYCTQCGRTLALASIDHGYRALRASDHPMARNNGRVLEHRLVAATALGRLLEPSEVVHHVNGDRLDNRPENLAVLESRADHARLHHKERRIVNLLALLEETDAAPLAGCPSGAPASVSSSTAKAALIAEPGRSTPRRACGRAQTKGA